MLQHLENMFTEVRYFLLDKGRNMKKTVGKNPKGDFTKAFDLKAEEIVVRYCRKNSLPFQLYSEESGIIKINNDPDYTLVLDPVDGSNNFSRDVEWVGFSAALVKGNLNPENVKAGLVGNVFTGTIYKSEGKGSFRNNKKIRVSKKANIKDSSFVIAAPSFKKRQKLKSLLPLMEKARHVRRCGSVSLEVANVASGGFDSFVDIVDKCTPENFLAGYLLVKDSGGIFTDMYGKPLKELNMTTGYNIVASCNKKIHKKVLELISK